MDFLDQSLHKDILTALASNLASTSQQDDLGLLTDSFASLEPVTNGAVNGILSRLAAPLNGAQPSTTFITQQQAESILAFAQYAASSKPPLDANLSRVVELLRTLPQWEVEVPLGIQVSQEWALSDQLAYELVHSALSVLDRGVGDRPAVLGEVIALHESITNAIASSAGYRIISHLLPVLNGLRRALSTTPFQWKSDDPAPFKCAFDRAGLDKISTAASHEWTVSTEEGRTSLATLQLYSSSLKGLAPGLAVLSSLEAQETYLATILTGSSSFNLVGWPRYFDGLRKSTTNAGISRQASSAEGLEIFSQTLSSINLVDSEETVEPDPYAFELLLSSLTVATLACIASGSIDKKVVALVESLVGESSAVVDEGVQTRAAECLTALIKTYPSIHPQATRIIRDFILSPSPVFELGTDHAPSKTLVAASECFAACLKVQGDSGVLQSAIQSLFNNFVVPPLANSDSSDTRSIRSSTGTLSRTDSQKELISSNIAHSVGRLALHFGDHQSKKLAISMLLQKRTNTHATIDGAISYEVAELAGTVEQLVFVDVTRAFSSAIQSSSSNDSVRQAVLTAQTRLAQAAATRKELHRSFLVELLTLFIDTGVSKSDSKQSKAERSQDLLSLIPVLDTFLTSSDADFRRVAKPSEVSLFRSMWYLCCMSGFLSSPARIADWQRAALVRIASHTPCLVADARSDFVETEVEFDSILRQSNHVISSDTIRSDLASLIPQQAGQIRGLSSPQVVFLMTVLRVESLRAEAGFPSVMLSYFEAEGVTSTSMYPTLVSIAEKVNNIFVHHFSELVTTHSINSSVFAQVKAILLQCCHQYSKVRSVSLRYLNELVSSFPSLICDSSVVTSLLELLTALRRACQAEFLDEYTPVYMFHSLRGGFTLTLPDDYTMRNTVLSELHQHARGWLKAGITRAPFEMQGLLQDYIDGSGSSNGFGTNDEMGKSLAIDMIRTLPANAHGAGLPTWGGWKSDNSSQFARTFGTRSFFGGEASRSEDTGRGPLVAELSAIQQQLHDHKLHLKLEDVRSLLYRCGAHLVKSQSPDVDILRQMVSVPFLTFTEGTISLGQEVWTWVADAKPELESRIMVEVADAWIETIQRKKGLFSPLLRRDDPLDQETKFTPTDKDAMTKDFASASRLLKPHSILLSFLSSRFQAFRYRDRDLVLTCMWVILRSTQHSDQWGTHQLARELRVRLLSFGFCVLQGSRLESAVEAILRSNLYSASFSWFTLRPGWSYGSNRIQLKSDLQALEELHLAVKGDAPLYTLFTSTRHSGGSPSLPGKRQFSLPGAKILQAQRQQLLLALLDNEMDRLRLWINPLMDSTRGPVPVGRQAQVEANGRQLVQMAWSIDPAIAIQLPERLKTTAVTQEVTQLVQKYPVLVQNSSDALSFFIGESITNNIRTHLKHLLYWAPVSVISALRFLFPKFGGDPILLQYALRVLEHHPVEVTFFYIPQVVQALRNDALGYAERFIFETSKISQLFCHQIIWNMKANAYRGDAAEEEDPMKPTLDRMVDMIVASLSGEAQDFYQREFTFFDEVTSISAKLKPYIKATKLEKKAKIDEEMAKIKVDPGVYLPSNPDGVVVDIDRLSGRPLQSHAKAPFMATFKVHREKKKNTNANQDALIDLEEETENAANVEGFDTWQSAIFKVGDDCRQDVLALQIIAMHKNIFTALGLDLLVTPYRVTATGPGCGVIDVIPNATSRDEMGRAKVNDLRSFFITKYGNPDGVGFQRARTNFIQSMAAYSLLCYIVQIKDRHNGNIMIDGRGCITHIDFGFLFDIGPGGVKFEPSSFKLSHEMIVLMGGRDSVGFRQFTELTVKAFLACRPYAQAIVDTAALMADAQFPSYKDDGTMGRLKDRFKLELSEKEAALYMMSIVENARENPRAIVYDHFQKMTNGIPYAR
ncbi:hypothetical protein T439DRAFT_296348 [Meredithblackwellia eburnea MCA 4105]